MITKKVSRNTQNGFNFYTAAPLMETTSSTKSVGSEAFEEKNTGQTPSGNPAEASLDKSQDEGAVRKGEQSDVGQTPVETGENEFASPTAAQTPLVLAPIQNAPSTNKQAFAPSEGPTGQQQFANGNTLSVKSGLQEGGSTSGAAIKPGFELPGGPTHSIDGDNLEDLMDHLDGAQWGGQVWDSWTGTEVTPLVYKFATKVSDLRGWMQDDIAYTNLFGEKLHNFYGFTGDQVSATKQALDRWAEVSNVRFLQVNPDQKADITFFGFDFGIAGYSAGGQSSGVHETDGSFVKLHSGAGTWETTGPGGFGYFTLIHEIGHSLGLPHPGEYDGSDDNPPTYKDDAEYIQDTKMYTVMSYFQEENTGGEWGGSSDLEEDYAQPATIQTHDMYVIQQKYGINWDTFSGDTTYGYNSNTNRIVYDFDLNPTPVIAIWDGGGFDTLDLSEDGSGVFIDLNPGAFSSTHGLTHNISITYEPDEIEAGHNALIEAAVGGDGNDHIVGNRANNVLAGGQGGDRLEGGDGDDELLGGSGTDRLLGGDGDDTLDGGRHWDELDGGNGDDELHGGQGNDILGGGDGDDDLIGDRGNDELFGGDGDDNLVGGAGNDLLNGGGGNDSLNGSGGSDTADYSYASSALTIDLAGVVEALDQGQVWGWATRDHVNYEGVYNIENVLSGTGDDTIFGSSLNNVLEGGDGDDTIHGRSGRDNLKGGKGNDLLRGGEGEDTLSGGVGTDTADYRYSDADWTISLSFGTATDGGADNDALSGIENVILGDGHDVVRGNSTTNMLDGGRGSDNLTGLAGDDILLGQTGNDVLNGGAGNDILSGGSGLDTADYSEETKGVRVDLAITSQQDTVGAGLDTISGIENLEGSQHGDWLFGNDVRNVIEGGLGDDNLFGRGGDDLIWGQQGNDILVGGLGDDGLIGGDGVDTASYLFASGGVKVDLSISGQQDTWSDGLDALASIENLSGSLHSDILIGDKLGNRIDGLHGNDALSGMAGDDIMFGGAGNDFLAGGDGNDVLEGGSGIDWAVYTSAVIVNLDQETQNTFGAGIDTLRDIENLSGSIHGDALGGDAGRNEINGNGGNDWLFGRAGNDTLRGGAGDDMIAGNSGSDGLYGGSGGDTFIFEDAWGNDIVHDFVVGEDVLDFGLVSGVEGTFNFHINESDGSAVIGFGLTNSVTLIGVSVGELDTSDWVL